jgi:hypothetical protein
MNEDSNHSPKNNENLGSQVPMLRSQNNRRATGTSRNLVNKELDEEEMMECPDCEDQVSF